MRFYSTILKQLPDDKLPLILENVKKSVRGHPVPIKNTYWYNVYRNILENNRSLFIIQNNNLKAQQMQTIKATLKSKDWGLLQVHNRMFKAAVRDQFGKSEKSKLQVMTVGSCLLAFNNASDELRPTLLKDLGDAVKKTDLDLMGGSLDNMLLTRDLYEQVLAMPPLSVQRQMLLGLLESPARGLIGLLGTNPSLLVGLLEQRKE
ncbi:hypothetical protein EDD86DRAFT_144958 [Gorgonomyces haynaldii]|nr:hypothetical protein EDD86DRAFT_144958 [Gorgonomyces haynaldii]